MPPLTVSAERFAPRATGFCIDERTPSPGRSRSASLASPSRVRPGGIACSAFRLAGQDGSTPTRASSSQDA
jgi:hypothetical protein